MKKIIIISLFLLAVTAIPVAFAEETTTATAPTAEVTAADLGVANPGILPSSPFYFLKNWGRNIKRAVTLNPVKKAELELDIANQQAAEIKKMEEVSPDKIAAITKATQKYQDNMERLKNKIGALKEDGKNPNVDKLIEKLADRTTKHQQLFEELKSKFENKPEMQQRLEEMKDNAKEVVSKLPEKLDRKEAVEKMIKEAEAMIVKAEAVIATATDQKLKDLAARQITDIKAKLESAKKLLADGKVGEAFGQATSSLAQIRNILMKANRPMIVKPIPPKATTTTPVQQ
jgi:DNA repair ATPase RecN